MACIPSIFIKTSQFFFDESCLISAFTKIFFGKLRMLKVGPWGRWMRASIFQASYPSKKSMLPKANKQRKKILNHITLNTLIPHIYFDFLGKGLLTQAVLASEKRDSMHLSVPTLHRNKVKDSCFLQDARIPMTIFLHSLPWDLHLRWCLHLHLWLTRLLRKPIVWNRPSLKHAIFVFECWPHVFPATIDIT